MRAKVKYMHSVLICFDCSLTSRLCKDAQRQTRFCTKKHCCLQGVPIIMLDKNFANFRQNFLECQPAESTWNLALELCHALSKYYSFEDAKIAAVCPIFRRLLGEEIFRITFSQCCHTDGSVANTANAEQFRVRGHEASSCDLGFKNKWLPQNLSLLAHERKILHPDKPWLRTSDLSYLARGRHSP